MNSAPTPPAGHPPLHYDIHDPAFAQDPYPAYAMPLAIGTLAEFTNLPREDTGKWSAWITRMFDVRDRDAGQRAATEFGAYIDELITRRRRAPIDDFVSKLIAAEIDGHKLTDREVHSFLTVTFGAGFETTQDAMTNVRCEGHFSCVNASGRRWSGPPVKKQIPIS